eukprot:gnl/TRDRNA2_/TRDRNA2_175332_c0_seq4.p1 gnl/TRDRNA2_/TRDRNA2_175332_c0~~gnl/TRDRNA2_/TRDRNA2_175332_c0_seq4.p1  ORF type:complete len:598 (+),score=111.30 gnl/TRDRNA2_/TRDRNA2_175332_c0_seq4:2-1795(+)
MMFDCWKKVYTDRKAEKLEAANREAARRKSNTLQEKTMLLWGNGDKSVMLHTLMRAWGEVVANRKLDDEEARKVAEKKNMGEANKAKIKRVLMKWESGNNEFLQKLLFGNWRDWYASMKEKRLAEKREAEKAQNSEAKKRANHVQEKTMLLWGQGNDKMLLHTMMRVWSEVVAEAKETSLALSKVKDAERLKRAHDNKMKAVLMRWDSENVEVMKRCSLDAWAQVWKDDKGKRTKAERDADEAKRRQGEEAARKRANHVQEKTMLLWGQGDKKLILHTFMRAWSETAAEEKKLAEFARFKQYHNLKVDAVIQELQRRNHIHHTNVIKACHYHNLSHIHEVVSNWYDPPLDHEGLDIRASHIAERAGLKEIHSNKITATGVKAEKARRQFLLHYAFYEWKDAAHETKRAQLLGLLRADEEPKKEEPKVEPKVLAARTPAATNTLMSTPTTTATTGSRTAGRSASPASVSTPTQLHRSPMGKLSEQGLAALDYRTGVPKMPIGAAAKRQPSAEMARSVSASETSSVILDTLGSSTRGTGRLQPPHTLAFAGVQSSRSTTGLGPGGSVTPSSPTLQAKLPQASYKPRASTGSAPIVNVRR